MSTPASSLHRLLQKAKTESIPQEIAEQLVIAACLAAIDRSPTRMQLYSAGEDFAPEELERIASRLSQFIERYKAGEPLQHITGVQAFLDHEYLVNPAVLIPRPETEILVLMAISRLEKEPPRLGLELGLGSGILSIELLCRFKELKMVASEVSSRAIPLAARNAVRILGQQDPLDIRLTILLARPSEIWEPFKQALGGRKADFLISNPPYLLDESEAEAAVIRTEPRQALFAPLADPLYFYREIARGLRDFIRPGGYAFFEIPHERAGEIAREVERESGFREVQLLQDLTGRDRVLVAKWIE